MPAQNQNKSHRVKIDHDFKEHRRPYAHMSDSALYSDLQRFRQREGELQDDGAKCLMRWHIRALESEILGRANGLIDRLI